jgi:putative N6-adenine-specific DNA methylase
VQFLASTNRGLEGVTAQEIERLVGAKPETLYPGMITFEAEASATTTLHRWARTLHRVLIERVRGTCSSLDDIGTLASELDVTEIFGPESAFAVRAQRHGDQEFGSPDVEAAVGQAIVDRYREVAGERPPVDLDNPDIVFRVFVRHERVIIAVDATGARSLHRRWYRKREHDAALRPTIAASMLQIAGYDGTRRLVDPMCGAGTVPIEAGLLADGRPPTPDHEPAYSGVRFLDEGAGESSDSQQESPQRTGAQSEILGLDSTAEWVAAARRNAEAAGVDGMVRFDGQDATTHAYEGGVVVTDLPFGIRTDDRNIAGLYGSFFDALADAAWDRLVLLTTRDDLVPYEPTTTYDIRRGRLDASIIVVD